MKTPLHKLQENFVKGFQTPESMEAFTENVVSDELTAAERVAIYDGSIRACLARALAEIYPVCVRLVGEEFFLAMAARYVAKYASTSPDLGDYGEAYSQFMETFPPLKELPYMPDVARLEWAWHRAFVGPDAAKIDFQELAGVVEKFGESISLQIPENASLIKSDYPVSKIWETNQEDYKGDDAVKLDEGSEYLIVWRNGLRTQIDLLNEIEFKVLELCASHCTMTKLCESMAEVDLTTILAELTKRGYFCGFDKEE